MTRRMTVDLHALANEPGFGRASEELERAGLIKPQVYRFTVIARARSLAHAHEIAERIAEDGCRDNLLVQRIEVIP